MSITLPTSITGGAQTGFTSPTYTLAADQAPTLFGKQMAVTAAGGTQAGVTVHSPASPFTLTWIRPKGFKTFPILAVANALLKNVPLNTHRILVRKGTTPAAGQPPAVSSVDCRFNVAAGADTYDSPNVRAMVSLLAGFITASPAAIGDTLVTGIT